MHENNRAIATRQTSQGQSSQGLDRVNEIYSVLAPIRAIGMTDEMASDWAAVIIAECRVLSDNEFAAGCTYAKRNCSDHRGVLKAIFTGSKDGRPCPIVAAMRAPATPQRISGPRPIGEFLPPVDLDK